jgi:hypothetical protein
VGAVRGSTEDETKSVQLRLRSAESDPALSSPYRSTLRLGLQCNGRRGTRCVEALSGASCGREQPQDAAGGLSGAAEALEAVEVVQGIFGFARTAGDSTPSVSPAGSF